MAAEAIVSVLLEQLASITLEEAQRQISLVGDVKKEVKKLTTNLQAIKAVLVDAEQRQVKEEIVKLWLDELKDMSYDMEDVLDEWNTEILKLQIEGGAHEIADHHVSKKKVCCFLPSFYSGITQIPFRRDIAIKIEELNQKLSDIDERKNRFNFGVTRSNEKSARRERETTSLVDVSEICGRESEKKTLVNKLLSESSDPQPRPRVISIVGMGGIGKTTLAQLAYKDDEISRNFHKKIWVCVSDPFDTFKIAKAILESLNNQSQTLTTLESLLGAVGKYIGGNKFFLVLDDVWTEDYNEWEPLYNSLKDGLPGSKILVTTRMETVALTVNSYSSDILSIEELSEDECWSLFKKLAFFDRAPQECEELEEIGRKIVNMCKGLPLAAKTMGSLLRHKKTKKEWQLILDDEMWKLKSFEKGIFPPLLLSYNDLPPMVKSCFLYCAIFPKDWKINRNELIYLWMAQGYLLSNQNKEMEIIGKEYFDMLASRSFFQEFEKDEFDDNNVICKMHDIVHEIALFLSRDECLAVEDNDFENSSRNFSGDKIRHLMLTITKGENYPTLRVNLKRLHSLLIYENLFPMGNAQFPLNMGQLTHLRALRFDSHVVEIPREITRFMYLRFLHLIMRDDDKMEVLPDTLCELCNLQTLRVDRWGFVKSVRLTRLPLGMEKLIKLRHLLLSGFSGLSCMPKGIEKLTSLQTLTNFIVNGSVDDNNACTLEALKNLNHLGGYIEIKWLGSVKDASEIQKAELGNKKNLVVLSLDFDNWRYPNFDKRRGHTDLWEILEAFQLPPPNLEVLKISKYEGRIVSPNWMMSLSTLKKLVLDNCATWVCLPPLGNWPYLESLEISSMKTIRRVSNEFLGVESGGALSSSSSSNIVIFPKLKSLQFCNLKIWKEWDYGITRKDEEHITIMPHLQSLEFVYCPRLKVLPEELFQRTTLEELKINEWTSKILKERYEEWSSRRTLRRLNASNYLIFAKRTSGG